jgi:hypothetical protein
MMTRPTFSMATTWRLFTIWAALLSLSTCFPSSGATPASTHKSPPPQSAEPARSTTVREHDPLSDVPDEARDATRQGDPRTVGYEAVWNACAPDSRAEFVAANGGREAGWIIRDDLLTNPASTRGSTT